MSAQSPSGERFALESWRWSDVSVADAKQLAHARAQELAARVRQGETLNRYSYGTRPAREEIIRGIPSAGGEVGIITRNPYGALVLNAPQAMFIDIDFPSGKTAAPELQRTLNDIEKWWTQNSGLGLRVYRTYGGLRVLVMNELFDPTQERGLAIMRELHADPLYITLCKAQECFRARLSPKPWRCNADKPPSRYPFANARAEGEYRAWERQYQAAASRYAVCQLLVQFGRADVHPGVLPVIQAHDAACLSNRPMPLA
ncbi:MAG: hypothetical protein WCF84_00470 [Anaerolineae bacterium]